MAKRYHQTKKDRSHESKGMKSYDMKNYNEGYYEGYDDKKRREMTDGSMIHEDRSAIANLPQDVKYHEYPKAGYFVGEYLNDTKSGIDHQENVDGKQMRRHMQPEKY